MEELEHFFSQAVALSTAYLIAFGIFMWFIGSVSIWANNKILSIEGSFARCFGASALYVLLIFIVSITFALVFGNNPHISIEIIQFFIPMIIVMMLIFKASLLQAFLSAIISNVIALGIFLSIFAGIALFQDGEDQGTVISHITLPVSSIEHVAKN